ncbi:MAG: AMP-binding protein, partial [bacterium]|nr:AMP-binding protein [bacterium]
DDFETYAVQPTIGGPINNAKVYILDREQKILPVGIAGELCIAGNCLARGYLNRPELTAEKFIPFPLSAIEEHDTQQAESVRIYRTGDLARWLLSGNIEFIGRIDHQVKIRGFRIELEEIESCLLEHETVEEAIVRSIEDVRKEGAGEISLCAYIVTQNKKNDAGTTSLSKTLRKHLTLRIPDYMVPTYFVHIERMPLTPNGKIDTKALPEPETGTSTGYVPPQDEIQKKLVAIWSEIQYIEKEKIGIEHDLFQLGGTSLNLIMLAGRIQNELGIEILVANIFENPTIKMLARLIQSETSTQKPVMQLNQPTGKNLFCFPPRLGYGMIYLNLARKFDDYTLYSFNYIDEDDRLNRYVETITSLQPEPPYQLFGWSAAGYLVFPVAAKMEEMGHEVSDIILADCFFLQQENQVERGADPENWMPKDEDLIELGLKELGLMSMKDKVIETIKKYVIYRNGIKTLEKVKANVHFILSTEERERKILECWDPFTIKKPLLYEGAGKHSEMLSGQPLEHNAGLIRKILDGIAFEK